MLSYAIIAFAVAALGGLALASSVLRGKFAAWTLSHLHAALGAVGLVMVLIAVLNGAGTPITLALVLLAATALGGFHLASLHLHDEIAPGGVVLLHASAAIGFLLLAGTAFRRL